MLCEDVRDVPEGVYDLREGTVGKESLKARGMSWQQERIPRAQLEKPLPSWGERAEKKGVRTQ